MTQWGVDDDEWARAVLRSVGAREVTEVELLAGKHADRLVVGAVADGRPVVVKRMSGDRRQRSLGSWRELWESPFGALRTPPGLPELIGEVDALDAVVLERVGGARLAGRSDVAATTPRIAEVARLLHDLHAVDVRPPVEHDIDGLVHALRSAVDRRAPAEHRGQLRSLVDLMDTCRPVDGDVATVHGDFNPRNVFVAPEGLRLIDLDVLQSADPAVDLGHWSAWCWIAGWYQGSPSWHLGAALVEHYTALGAPSGFIDRVAFHEAARLLRISLGSAVMGRRPEIADDVVRAGRERLATISGR